MEKSNETILTKEQQLDRYRKDTIKAMLDANEYFPQTQILIRLAAARRYLAKVNKKFEYKELFISESHMAENEYELSKMVTKRLGNAHAKAALHGKTIKLNDPGLKTIPNIGLWYKNIYDQGVYIAEQLYACCMQAVQDKEEAQQRAEEILELIHEVFSTKAVADEIRDFKNTTEARDDVWLRDIITTAQEQFKGRLIAFTAKHNVMFPERRINDFIYNVFSPQRVERAAKRK